MFLDFNDFKLNLPALLLHNHSQVAAAISSQTAPVLMDLCSSLERIFSFKPLMLFVFDLAILNYTYHVCGVISTELSFFKVMRLQIMLLLCTFCKLCCLHSQYLNISVLSGH